MDSSFHFQTRSFLIFRRTRSELHNFRTCAAREIQKYLPASRDLLVCNDAPTNLKMSRNINLIWREIPYQRDCLCQKETLKWVCSQQLFSPMKSKSEDLIYFRDSFKVSHHYSQLVKNENHQMWILRWLFLAISRNVCRFDSIKGETNNIQLFAQLFSTASQISNFELVPLLHWASILLKYFLSDFCWFRRLKKAFQVVASRVSPG